MNDDHSSPHGADRQRTLSRWVFLAFVAIAAYFLITEHRAHLYGILPFLLLAACPLLHMFHHRGHGRGGPDPGGDSGGGDHRH